MDKYKKPRWALADVAQLAGASSHNRKVVDLKPGQGTYISCGFCPQSRHIQEATNQCFSFSFPLSLPLSKRAMKKMSLGEDLKKTQHAEWKKPDTKDYILCESTHRKFWTRVRQKANQWFLSVGVGDRRKAWGKFLVAT